MNNLKDLHELLSDFIDIDSWNYEFVRSKLNNGFYISMPAHIVKHIFKYQSGRHVPLSLDIISKYILKVATPMYSSLEHGFKIRKHCHKVIVFFDEHLIFDIVLPQEKKRLGKRAIVLNDLVKDVNVPQEIMMDKFFAKSLEESNKILIFLQIKEFSKTRIDFENKEAIFDTRRCYTAICDNEEWQSKLQQMIYEDQPSQILDRSALWGYDRFYWDKNMKGVNIIPWCKEALKLEKLPIKDIYLLQEFKRNFDKKEVSNEEIMNLSVNTKLYYERVADLIKNIKESNGF